MTINKAGMRRFQATHGQALVEFALVLPVLLLLILGAMDFGRLYRTKVVITNAAREGANYLSYNPTDADDGYITTLAVTKDEALNSGVPLADENITPEVATNSDYPYEEMATVTVAISNIDLIFSGFYQTFFPSADFLDLSSTVKMVVQ